VSSLQSQIEEAARSGVHNPIAILGATLAHTVGAGQLYEAVTDRALLSQRELHRTEEERWESGTEGVLGMIMTGLGLRSALKGSRGVSPGEGATAPEPIPDHPGMDQWVEEHDPSPRPIVSQGTQVPAAYGESGVAFTHYSRSGGWAFIEGPSGAGGHAWNAPGFDGVVFRSEGQFEMEIYDNKTFKSTKNISDASAITDNIETNLIDLEAKISDPAFNDVPRINDVRTAVSNARAAVQSGAPLPSNVRLVVRNFGGRSAGITAGLRNQGIDFEESN